MSGFNFFENDDGSVAEVEENNELVDDLENIVGEDNGTKLVIKEKGKRRKHKDLIGADPQEREELEDADSIGSESSEKSKDEQPPTTEDLEFVDKDGEEDSSEKDFNVSESGEEESGEEESGEEESGEEESGEENNPSGESTELWNSLSFRKSKDVEILGKKYADELAGRIVTLAEIGKVLGGDTVRMSEELGKNPNIGIKKPKIGDPKSLDFGENWFVLIIPVSPNSVFTLVVSHRYGAVSNQTYCPIRGGGNLGEPSERLYCPHLYDLTKMKVSNGNTIKQVVDTVWDKYGTLGIKAIEKEELILKEIGSNGQGHAIVSDSIWFMYCHSKKKGNEYEKTFRKNAHGCGKIATYGSGLARSFETTKKALLNLVMSMGSMGVSDKESNHSDVEMEKANDDDNETKKATSPPPSVVSEKKTKKKTKKAPTTTTTTTTTTKKKRTKPPSSTPDNSSSDKTTKVLAPAKKKRKSSKSPSMPRKPVETSSSAKVPKTTKKKTSSSLLPSSTTKTKTKKKKTTDGDNSEEDKVTPSTLRKFFGDHGSLGKFFNGDFGETDGDSGKDEEPPETYTPGEIQKIMSNDKDEEGRLISTCCLLLSTLVTRVSEEFRSKVNDIKFEKGEKMSIMVYITYIVVKGYPTSHIGELAVALYKKASVLKKGEVLSSSDFFLFRDAFNFLNKYGEEETVYDPMVDAPENVIPGGPMSLFG